METARQNRPAGRIRVEGLRLPGKSQPASLHSLALDRDGSVWGWCDNSHFQWAYHT
jgi:alpha-tubulin suppressor-like RCC1 family protein